MLNDKYIDIIQNKVDGVLSANEEAVFQDLINASPEAKELYEELLNTHRALRQNASEIPPVTFTADVMRRIKGNPARRQAVTGSGRFYAFAAMLVLVFVLGILAAYYLPAPDKFRLSGDLSGTMARKENGVEIDVQEYNRNGFRMYLIAVSAKDSLYVEFSNADGPGCLNVAHTDGIIAERTDNEPGLLYVLRGNVIFTLSNAPAASELIFSTKDKQIFLFKVPPTF